ncbi:MAG: pyrroline-5-carboxylate reductase [Eubacteriales bacterium]
MKKIAFIGAGNMASAIAGGIIKSGTVPASDIILFDKNEEQYKKFDPSCRKASSAKDATLSAGYIFFSVKPQNIKDVLAEISSLDNTGKVFISICAGITIESIERQLGKVKTVRAMPNTPLLIGQGVTALCKNGFVTEEEFNFVSSLFSSSGYTTEIEEKDFSALTALTSSSPAYVYLFAKSMLTGAQKLGFAPDDAVLLVCKMIIGSANMILSDSRSLDELIRMVKSPNGTTEKALDVFEENNFTDIVCKAMKACADRAEELAEMN